MPRVLPEVWSIIPVYDWANHHEVSHVFEELLFLKLTHLNLGALEDALCFFQFVVPIGEGTLLCGSLGAAF